MFQTVVRPEDATWGGLGQGAYAYLPAVLERIFRGGRPDLVSTAIRGYCELGLWGPAGELLPALPACDQDSSAARAVGRMIQSGRTGQLSWKACQGRFRRNLETLLARDGRWAAVAEAWEQARKRYELYRSRDGNYQVALLDDAGRRRWVPALRDHRAWAARQPLQHDPKTAMPLPYLFEGLGQGHYLRRVHEATRDTFLGYSCALFIVERDPVAFAVALHVQDWQKVFADPRVRVFVGEDCLDRLRALLAGDVDLPLPRACVQMPRWSPELDPRPIEVISAVAEESARRDARRLDELAERYAPRDVRYWARRFSEALDGSGPPLRILSAVSNHTTFLQYSMRDAHAAFQQLGCQTRLLMEPSDHHCISEATYHQAVAELDPDVYFVIDYLRGGHEQRLPANLPIFTWDQDQLPHAFNTGTARTIGPLDVVAGVSAGFCVTTLGCDPRRVAAVIMPTNPERFSAEPVDEEQLARHRCDVSFVSHASQTPQEFHDQQRRQVKGDGGRRLLDRVQELVVEAAKTATALTRSQSEALVDRAGREVGVSVPEASREWLLGWYIWRVMDRSFRHQALGWVARWAQETGRKFHLYGRGWERHATLGRFARGEAHNEQALRCIYQASAINLQLIPSGFLHQRALDGLAAGGFFLTRQTTSDHQYAAIRRILARVAALGIDSLTDPRAADDAELQAAIRNYEQRTGLECDVHHPAGLAYLRVAGTYPCAGEVFPRFDEIVFSDEASFRRAADRFLGDPQARRTLAADMRQAVTERFSYTATMRRFLEFHRDHLLRVAGESATASGRV